jgi:para-aminobenzoate synthetase component 1
MISTISCEIEASTSFSDVIEATFPMGSMTGAPKHSAMQLIESHENFKRGLYSGAIGYIAPNGEFDLNVVIRSLIYNKNNKSLSCPVG